MPSISSFQLSEEKTDYVSPLSQYGEEYVYSSIPFLQAANLSQCLRCSVRKTSDLFAVVASTTPKIYPTALTTATFPDIPPLPSDADLNVVYPVTVYRTGGLGPTIPETYCGLHLENSLTPPQVIESPDSPTVVFTISPGGTNTPGFPNFASIELIAYDFLKRKVFSTNVNNNDNGKSISASVGPGNLSVNFVCNNSAPNLCGCNFNLP